MTNRLHRAQRNRLAATPFLPGARSWAARAIQDHGIAVSVVSLPDDLRERLLEAQRR